jgi:hypothetical protein
MQQAQAREPYASAIEPLPNREGLRFHAPFAMYVMVYHLASGGMTELPDAQDVLHQEGLHFRAMLRR